VAVVTVVTLKCGSPECRYDIRHRQYTAACDCGFYGKFGCKSEAEHHLTTNHQRRGIVTWLS
jgi:hypothetical protein